jgi:hypothetical protein
LDSITCAGGVVGTVKMNFQYKAVLKEIAEGHFNIRDISTRHFVVDI